MSFLRDEKGLFLLAVCCVLSLKPVSAAVEGFRAPCEAVREHVPGFLWVEAESFADYGAWRLDTQFTHKMGSAYLLAVGVLKPIGEAKTTFAVPRAGVWHVWARTKDWLPEHSPGKFALEVRAQGRAARSPTLGASGRDGWCWEKAGDFELSAGTAELALVDLSGSFARCDAVLLTTDAAYVPPDEPEALAAARDRFCGRPETVAEGGAWDVVVVGAGPGGLGAAFAAARTGSRVALVHDRPVLGGNSSCELGVGTDGAAGSHPNRKLNSRESGLCEEANLLCGGTAERTLSAAYRQMASREPNLSVFANSRVLSAEKDGSSIAAVIARDTLTGVRTRYRAKIFIDGTGDGWVGFFAGADYMYGREARSEYDEWPAPEKRDDLTMSGCLMDKVCAYRYEQRDTDVPYVPPDWAKVLPPDFTRKVKNLSPAWWIEHGGRFDDLKDPERARDELVRISFAYWGWLKNESDLKDKATRAELTFVPFMNGRREGLRLVGDYVLTANDALEGRMFDDRISYGGWPLDTHDPLGMENPHGNGYWKHHPGVPEYSIPYRCLYSKNVPNLMFAGRCVSVTHIALGSVRVEATLFTLGQAAGTAAALALKSGLSPREYGCRHIRDLQQRLLKDDQFIPNLRNEDPFDLARTAHVTATSTGDFRLLDRGDAVCGRTQGDKAHPLNMPRATCLLVRGVDALQKIDCLLRSSNAEPVRVTARLWTSDRAGERPTAREPLAEVTAVVRPKTKGFVSFALPKAIRPDGPFLWVELSKSEGVEWLLRASPLGGEGARAYGSRMATVVPNEQYVACTTPPAAVPVDAKADYVIDGVSRPVGGCYHGWISDPAKGLPQAVRLDLARPAEATEVRLTFDTDLTTRRVVLCPYPRQLAKSYCVEGLRDGQWTVLADVRENTLRHRVHGFPRQRLEAVRVTVRETWGDPSARIFEIRIY